MDQALVIGIKITEAVHYMHTHDPIIIHQDIKPHNVLVCIQTTNIIIIDYYDILHDFAT